MTVVILHGWNLRASKFTPLVEELRERGYKTFCPDLPGFGKIKITGNSFSLSDYVDFVKIFIRRNKLPKIILIGHSFGGRIGIKFAAQYPKLLHTLILTGTPGITPVPRSKIIFFVYLAKLGRIIFSLPFLSLFQNNARKLIYRMAGATDFYNTNENMKETFKNIVKENLEPYLTQINNQTLLLWGREDKIIPINIAQKMQELIKDSRLVVIPDARHGLPWTHPKEFADEVEKFLR